MASSKARTRSSSLPENYVGWATFGHLGLRQTWFVLFVGIPYKNWELTVPSRVPDHAHEDNDWACGAWRWVIVITEARYWSRRAFTQMVAAIRAGRPEVAQAHEQLVTQYVSKALKALHEDSKGESADSNRGDHPD